uniref:Peptidase M12B domain-containing protein n=1 Tax=Panagrellus redivivus TaxID=6233 RepID=A0A7E4VHQ8_PANRE
MAFDNLSLSLDNVQSTSLDAARREAELALEISARNTAGNLKMDVLMVADHTLFEAFFELQHGHHDKGYFAASAYLEATFQQMEHIFAKQQFFGKHKIDLRYSGALVIQEARDCPLKHVFYGEAGQTIGNSTFDNIGEGDSRLFWSINATKALNSLIHWRRLHMDVLPKHDHIVFITKFDLIADNGDSGTQGLAYVANACGLAPISVVEDVGGLTTAKIACHEIGHNLGAPHDGEFDDCDPRENFMMAPSASATTNSRVFANGFTFSECSIHYIEKYLSRTNSSCLTAHVKKTPPEKRHIYRSPYTQEPVRKLKLGEQFGISKQCQIAFAPHYGECTHSGYTFISPDPCRRLWCKNRLLGRRALCETKSYIPMADGTECAKGKWCLAGACVANPYYDPEEGCEDINDHYCREKYSPSTMKIFCARKSFAAICCRQCKKYNQYIYDKYRDAEKRFRKKKVPPRMIKPVPTYRVADDNLTNTTFFNEF